MALALYDPQTLGSFFVALLGHVCCYTNLHILFNNSRLYPGVAYNYFFVLTYRPNRITQSRVQDV